MAGILAEVSDTCNPVDQDANIGLQKCDININNWYSFGALSIDGADFINTDGSGGFLADAAALKTKIETVGTFSAALALTGDDRLSFASKISQTTLPANINEDIERPDGSLAQSNIFKRQPITLRYYAPTSELHTYLFKFRSNQRRFFIVLPDGRFVFKTLTDAEVAAGESPFFDAEQIKVGGREGETGSTNEDTVPLMISTKYDELVKFTIYDTQAFGLDLVNTPVT